VENGTGTSKLASNAQTTGFSINTEFVCLFLINAPLLITQELASHATKATIYTMENAALPLSSKLVMLAVLPGTGISKFA
jgi:hypothetical protein